MKNYFIIFVLLFLGNFVSAQGSDEREVDSRTLMILNNIQYSPNRNSPILQFDNRYIEIQGSPFVMEDWKKGSIILDKGEKVLKGIFIMYNAYENEIWVKLDKQDPILLDNSLIKGFVINNDKEKHIFVKEDVKKYKAMFFEVFSDGKVTVLKKPHVNLFKSDNSSGYQMAKSQHFKASPKYFIKKGKGEFQLFKRRSKYLTKQFPKLKSKIKKHIKKEKIKLTKDEDLKKMMKWINDSLEKKQKDKAVKK